MPTAAWYAKHVDVGWLLARLDAQTQAVEKLIAEWKAVVADPALQAGYYEQCCRIELTLCAESLENAVRK